MKAEDYGDKYKDHLIEQYKLYVEMADNVSERRSHTNTFYITVLSALLIVLSLAAEQVAGVAQHVAFAAVAVLGIILCFVWYVNLEAYRQLNSGKFRTIHEIEEQLPFACYDREWEIMSMRPDGVRPQYMRLTKVEKFVPALMAIPYALLLLYAAVRLAN